MIKKYLEVINHLIYDNEGMIHQSKVLEPLNIMDNVE